MKTKQKPTAAATSALRQRSKEEEASRPRFRQPPSQHSQQSQQSQQQPQQCERERKHEAARKEREAQAQAQAQLRREPTWSSRQQATTMRPLRRPSQDRERPQASRAAAKQQTKAAAAGSKPASADESGSRSGSNDEESAKLRLQLEHLAQLSQQDFEREFRKWMAQEGIEGKMHAQLRMDLINTFNSTALGQLLSRATSTAAQMTQQQNCLLLSPLALALHTLVAEFLYEQNCHYTLSVFCSEMPHRHTLPDFEGRAEFRFNQEELQQVLTAVLGEHSGTQLRFDQMVLQAYAAPQQSLLLALLRTLVESRRTSIVQVSASTMKQRAWESRAQATQTEPTACLPSSSNVDTSRLYETEEFVVAADGRSVFVGPRVSQSLGSVEQQLSQLMHCMGALCKACAPPVEVITPSAFEQLLQEELLLRQRLASAGQKLAPGQTAVQLPEATALPQETQLSKPDASTVLSPVGPIQLPAEAPTVPQLPHLQPEQVASLAMVQQVLQQFQQQAVQPQGCMYLTLERLATLVGELAGCVQTLSNVLNLAMEQEYAVGRHKGYKLGYREGFSHGHYMGVQEGIHCQKQQQQEQQQEQQRLHQNTSSQTQLSPSPSREMRTAASQTSPLCQRHMATNTDSSQPCQRDAASQTAPAPAPSPAPAPAPAPTPVASTPSRSYERWIYEMLHSQSGQIFLERVELSLNKALEQQKQRLDELYDVKLRHHAELMRLSRRQNSWRTLCRHVERDSHSTEARELVHKIFRLLEHYEAHHQLLAEKIQQTEMAAEQAARIKPVWADAQATGASYRPAATMCSTPRSVSSCSSESLSVPKLNHYKPKLVNAAAAAAAAVDVGAAAPPKPQLHSVATNTNGRSRPIPDEPRAQLLPSFNEALLSAKNRMLQLEQESDLLEQSFVGYLERARAQKQKLNIRASCAHERQQIHRTLDSFREWQRRTRRDDVPPSLTLPPASSPNYSGSELDPESYQFTNAIAVARRKLFAELQATERPPQPQPEPQLELELELSLPAPASTRLVDQVQSETQLLLSRVEATLARVNKPASLQLLTVETQLDDAFAGELLSSGSLSTPAGSAGDGHEVLTPPASRKLQRSMAKMQQLFGSQAQPQATSEAQPQGRGPSKMRPWSAPTSGVVTAATPTTQRPHTAPSSRTDGQLLGVLDALSDVGNTTGNTTSSLASSLDSRTSAMHELYAQLVSNASSVSPASSSPALSPSQDFWKRMNL